MASARTAVNSHTLRSVRSWAGAWESHPIIINQCARVDTYGDLPRGLFGCCYRGDVYRFRYLDAGSRSRV